MEAEEPYAMKLIPPGELHTRVNLGSLKHEFAVGSQMTGAFGEIGRYAFLARARAIIGLGLERIFSRDRFAGRFGAA